MGRTGCLWAIVLPDLAVDLHAPISTRFQICSSGITDKLSIALISHARNAARYAVQRMERVHASGISLGFRNGSVFLSDMTLENVRVYPSILPLHPYNFHGIPVRVSSQLTGYRFLLEYRQNSSKFAWTGHVVQSVTIVRLPFRASTLLMGTFRLGSNPNCYDTFVEFCS